MNQKIMIDIQKSEKSNDEENEWITNDDLKKKKQKKHKNDDLLLINKFWHIKNKYDEEFQKRLKRLKKIDKEKENEWRIKKKNK